jgi:threonine dehydrogenase-like Zn-dependent dehydrogenase
VVALAAAAPGARVAHVGTAAGQEATIPSALVRGKQLDVLGYSTFAVPMEDLREGYRELLGHVAAGRIRVHAETLPLERLDEAWERQAAGPEAKLVVELRPAP